MYVTDEICMEIGMCVRFVIELDGMETPQRLTCHDALIQYRGAPRKHTNCW